MTKIRNKITSAQPAIEYLLLFALRAIVALVAFRTMLPRVGDVSNAYYDKVAKEIMDGPSPQFPELGGSFRVVRHSGSGSNTAISVSCNSIEYLLGGGLYFREISAGSSTDEVVMRPAVASGQSTAAEAFEIRTRAGQHSDVFAICHDGLANCRVRTGEDYADCAGGEIMTGGGCYLREVGASGSTDEVHAHPHDSNTYRCTSRESHGTAYAICCENLDCRLTHSARALNCSADEYLTGGGCYWREVSSSGSTDEVHGRPKVRGSEAYPDSGASTLGMGWVCTARSGAGTAYAICCTPEEPLLPTCDCDNGYCEDQFGCGENVGTCPQDCSCSNHSWDCQTNAYLRPGGYDWDGENDLCSSDYGCRCREAVIDSGFYPPSTKWRCSPDATGVDDCASVTQRECQGRSSSECCNGDECCAEYFNGANYMGCGLREPGFGCVIDISLSG